MILVAILAAVAVSSPQPTDIQKNDSYQSPPANYQTDHGTSPAAVPQLGRDERQYENQNPSPSKNAFLNWCDRYQVVITLAAAVAVAVFTGLLTLYTVKLWKSGEQHSEKELRAYISISPGMALINKDKPPQLMGVDCIIRNHGQTPAFEINHIFGISILDKGVELPTATEKSRGNAAVFPGVHIHTILSKHHAFTSDETADVMSGTRRLHIWGQVTYRDAFEKRRLTRFSASLGGADFAENLQAVQQGRPLRPTFRWTYEDRHNDAT